VHQGREIEQTATHLLVLLLLGTTVRLLLGRRQRMLLRGGRRLCRRQNDGGGEVRGRETGAGACVVGGGRRWRGELAGHLGHVGGRRRRRRHLLLLGGRQRHEPQVGRRWVRETLCYGHRGGLVVRRLGVW